MLRLCHRILPAVGESGPPRERVLRDLVYVQKARESVCGSFVSIEIYPPNYNSQGKGTMRSPWGAHGVIKEIREVSGRKKTWADGNPTGFRWQKHHRALEVPVTSHLRSVRVPGCLAKGLPSLPAHTLLRAGAGQQLPSWLCGVQGSEFQLAEDLKVSGGAAMDQMKTMLEETRALLYSR